MLILASDLVFWLCLFTFNQPLISVIFVLYLLPFNVVIYGFAVACHRNSIGKNQLVWVGPNVNVMYLIPEVLLLRGQPWFIGRGSYLDIALFSQFWLYGQVRVHLMGLYLQFGCCYFAY